MIMVITESAEFIVHRHKIFETSVYFRAACSGNWVEARDRTVVLDHFPATYFALYVEWISNKNLPCAPCCGAPFDGWMDDSVVHHERTRLKAHFWCQLWVFAGFLGDVGFQELCACAVEVHVRCPSFTKLLPETTELVLSETSERSDLQKRMRKWGALKGL